MIFLAGALLTLVVCKPHVHKLPAPLDDLEKCPVSSQFFYFIHTSCDARPASRSSAIANLSAYDFMFFLMTFSFSSLKHDGGRGRHENIATGALIFRSGRPCIRCYISSKKTTYTPARTRYERHNRPICHHYPTLTRLWPSNDPSDRNACV